MLRDPRPPRPSAQHLAQPILRNCGLRPLPRARPSPSPRPPRTRPGRVRCRRGWCSPRRPRRACRVSGLTSPGGFRHLVSPGLVFRSAVCEPRCPFPVSLMRAWAAFATLSFLALSPPPASPLRGRHPGLGPSSILSPTPGISSAFLPPTCRPQHLSLVSAKLWVVSTGGQRERQMVAN